MNYRILLSASVFLFFVTACANIPNHSFEQLMQHSARSEADKLRDVGRQPKKVLEFAEINAGMTVLDLVASGGYYTEVLSHWVGAEGKVLAHNTEFILTVRDGQFNQELTQRLTANRLKNVERYEREIGQIDLDSEVDAATMMLNYHDLYNRPVSQRMTFLSEIYRALKPNGVFVVIDMQANAGPYDSRLHRINEHIVKEEVAQVGFELTKQGDFLANPDDDHLKVVFDPSIRGNTDRFVLIFKKPAN
jgi:predicted methyltransferase